MIERIRELLSEKDLTAAAFADKLGVPRSTISHILSGRNKPSLEMVHKILDAFPDLRIEWLVRGEGTMYATHTLPRQADLFSQNEQATHEDHDSDAVGESQKTSSRKTVPYDIESGRETGNLEYGREADHTPQGDAPSSFSDKGKRTTASTQSPGNDSESVSTSEPISRSKLHSSAKAVDKIIILFRDGTFRDYYPDDA